MKRSSENKITNRAFKTPLLFTFCMLFRGIAAFSQTDTAIQSVYDSAERKYDSATSELFSTVKRFGTEIREKNINEYKEDTIASRQEEIVNRIRTSSLEAKSYLQNGLDTTGLSLELDNIEHWYEITSDGVFVNTGTIQTHRNLETSHSIIRELLTRTLARKSALDEYYNHLVSYRNTIDSLYKDSILYKLSSDSLVLMRYVKKIMVISQEIKPIDSSIKQTLVSLSELQTTLSRFVNRLNSSIEQIEIFQKDLASKRLSRETANLMSPVKYTRSFREIINFSMLKGWLSFLFYIRNEIGKTVLLLILIIGCAIFLANLKRLLRLQNISESTPDHLAVRHPVLSALVIVPNFFQFLFIDPPFIVTALLWLTSILSLTAILRNTQTGYRRLQWFVMLSFFLIAIADNLILQASRPERWLMLCLSIAGAIAGLAIIRGQRRQHKDKLIIYFIAFLIVIQIVSTFTNIYGRYNLSKTCLTAGFFNIAIATLFFWALRFVGQGLFLAVAAYKRPGKKLNPDEPGSKAPPIFYVILLVGWFVLFARNFYAFKFISEPVRDFLLQKRIIGDFSFSIGSLLEFFLILYLSGLTSRIVSFFASGKVSDRDPSTRKGGLGSWLLIIRIAIVTVGLLLAVAALGIPMDRLTIILSALSVGIGFGLQGLVNNLVSGLIISIEKPVNVGDIIEVGGQSGTIKSIGFRSSVISTALGSDVVIPNGDLLNQQLVNWTHENSSRAVDVLVGVAYGTELEKAIQILKDLLTKDERILQQPTPGVIIRQFSSSSIDMQLSFWVRDLREAAAVKSDIILAIDIAFKQNGIEIPLPQQDLHIRSIAKAENGRRFELDDDRVKEDAVT